MSSLTRIVPWSQQLVCEVLCPGDLAVDLTAGKGRDTLALAQAVGNTGQVVVFDLQAAALEQTSALLKNHGFTVELWSAGQLLPKRPGVFLVNACHSTLDKLLQYPVGAIMANLGYLPGGDPAFITRPASTLAALQQSLGLLSPGGRIAITVYPAHPGGREEGTVVEGLFGTLASDEWQVLSMRVTNCSAAPFLMLAERTH
jgi:hypothetical protein